MTAQQAINPQSIPTTTDSRVLRAVRRDLAIVRQADAAKRESKVRRLSWSPVPFLALATVLLVVLTLIDIPLGLLCLVVAATEIAMLRMILGPPMGVDAMLATWRARRARDRHPAESRLALDLDGPVDRL